MTRAVLLVALVLLALPATAGAATLRVTSWEWEYTAAPGEANDIEMTVGRIDGGRGRTHLRDDGAVVHLDAWPGLCEVVDEHEVECHGTGRVLTGDGDDRVTIGGEEAAGVAWLGPGDDVGSAHSVYGEEGDDTLTGGTVDGGDGADRVTLIGAAFSSAAGGPGDDVVIGTAGPDRLDAGDGSDRVTAGDGDDEVADGIGPESGRDELDGGAGRDTLRYDSRPGPVRLDLAAGIATSDGVTDAVPGFEGAVTGPGDDVLVGTGGADLLDGGQGDDRIDGAAGDDRLTAGWGDDVLAGGPGNDVLDGDEHNEPTFDVYSPVLAFRDPDRDALDGGDGDDRLVTAGDRWVDRVVCGAGTDAVEAETIDAASPACETVQRRPLPSLFQAHRVARGPSIRVRGRTAAVQVPCAVPSIGGVVALKRGRRILGRATWRCAPNPDLRLLEASQVLRVRLGRSALRRLRRVRRLPVTVVMGWDVGSVPSRDASALVFQGRR